MDFNNFYEVIKNLLANQYVKVIVVYLLYVLIVIFLLLPVVKSIITKITHKTKTKWDDEIQKSIGIYVKILFILFGLNLIYNLYLVNSTSYFHIAYKVLLTLEFGLIYFILHRFFKVSLKYIVRKFSGIITKNVVNFIKLLVDIFVFSVVTLLILKAWGVNITPLLASAGIFGLAVAMASKSIIENFLSGLILFADKTINVGDTIVLSDGTTAVVEEINIRTTRLKTFDGNVVIIPNSELLNEKIINKSSSEITPQKRLEVSVGISYNDDVDLAKNLLKKYLLELDGVDPKSVVVFVNELADWSVNIKGRIMVSIDKYSYLLEKQVLEKIYKEFPKNGLNFPFPTYQLTGELKCGK